MDIPVAPLAHVHATARKGEKVQRDERKKVSSRAHTLSRCLSRAGKKSGIASASTAGTRNNQSELAIRNSSARPGEKWKKLKEGEEEEQRKREDLSRKSAIAVRTNLSLSFLRPARASSSPEFPMQITTRSRLRVSPLAVQFLS